MMPRVEVIKAAFGLTDATLQRTFEAEGWRLLHPCEITALRRILDGPDATKKQEETP